MPTKPRAPLAGRVALVTGAGRGIGRAIALTLAKAGADLALLDCDRKAAAVVAREIGSATARRVLPVAADVTDPAQVRRAVHRVIERLGRLDLLVNNAGIWSYGRLGEIEVSDWDRILAVNLKGILVCTQAVLPSMREQGGGKIVNIASAAGLGPAPEWVAYGVSKAAAIMLSRVAAVELKASGIQVHCLCPGAVDTDLARQITALTGETFPHAMGPDEVAVGVMKLVTPFRSKTTGRVVSLCAGEFREVTE